MLTRILEARLEHVQDAFIPRPSPYRVRLILGHGDIERERGRVRFVLEDAPAGRLSDAQFHDYAGGRPQAYRWRPPLHGERVDGAAAHRDSAPVCGASLRR